MRKCMGLGTLFLFLFSSLLFAQNAILTGTVRNSTTGEGIPAVSVTVVGGTQGTFTDGSGVFRISVSQLPAVLRFSSVGFETQDVTVDAADYCCCSPCACLYAWPGSGGFRHPHAAAYFGITGNRGACKCRCHPQCAGCYLLRCGFEHQRGGYCCLFTHF
jgi:hypothetical protein